MKTAISLPDDLFHEVEACSRRLKVSRSRFFVVAAREFLSREQAPADATTVWNAVIAQTGQPGDDPSARALRRRSRSTLAAAARRRR